MITAHPWIIAVLILAACFVAVWIGERWKGWEGKDFYDDEDQFKI